MKVLIAYDGSECSDAAVVDLRRAGLPPNTEAFVLSVAEMPVGLATATFGNVAAGSGYFVPEAMEVDVSTGTRLEEAHAFAARAADRLRADFPNWLIKKEAWIDAAGSAIIRKAHAWKPDLVVVGSHGHSGFGRLMLGSVSQHVSHHASCSVRISRHHLHSQDRSIRLLVGVDGSTSATKAVHAVAARDWPKGTEVRVVGVLDSRIAIAAASTPPGALAVEFEEESRRELSKAIHEAAKHVETNDLFVTHQVLVGHPDAALLAEAEKWCADCIFVGARGMSGFQRLLLGSVSTVVSAKAHCSVEIVR